jgi:hypothetical protein
MTDPEERLWRALIDNAADDSLNPGDEWNQEIAKWFFYTEEYELLHKWVYDVPGDGFRERLEILWDDCSDDPALARKYRLDLRKLGVNQERNVRLHYGPAPPASEKWLESNAMRDRDDNGRYK